MAPPKMKKLNEEILVLENLRNKEKIEPNEDKFNFNKYIEPFIAYLNSFEPPVSIGIYGKWGSGKSVFLNFVKGKIESEENQFIVFDAWRYNDNKSLWKSFILFILNNLKFEKKSRKLKKEIEENLFVSKESTDIKSSVTIPNVLMIILGMVFIWSILIFSIISLSSGTEMTGSFVTDTIAFVAFWLTVIVSLISIIQVKKTKKVLDLDYDLSEKFKEIVNSTCAKKVYIAIENIDRCCPSQAIRLLETLKSVISVKKCVYIILCDHKVLEKEIQNIYNDEAIKASDHLNKIIEIPFYLPEPEIILLREYIKSLLSPNFRDRMDVYRLLEVTDIKNPRNIKTLFLEWNLSWIFLNKMHPQKEFDSVLLLKLLIMEKKFSSEYRDLKVIVEGKGDPQADYKYMVYFCKREPHFEFGLDKKINNDKEEKKMVFIKEFHPFPKSINDIGLYLTSIETVTPKKNMKNNSDTLSYKIS